jgi:hypothetical protein
MPRIAQSHFHGVRPGDHYMPLQRLTVDHMSCFATGFLDWVRQNNLRPLSQLLGFPVLGMTEYP